MRQSLFKIFFLLLSQFFLLNPLYSQDLEDLVGGDDEKNETVIATFKTTRVINGHSIETVKRRTLDTRVTHRFDDIFGNAGGIHTLYGLDNVTDIRIAFEYGINDQFTVGAGRSKGGAAVRELIDGYLKYRLLEQTSDNKMPIAVTLMANSAISTMLQSGDTTSVTSFPKTVHRISYVVQPIIARKFSNNLSLQVMPTYVHRNFVAFGDENSFFAIGVAGRLKFTKRIALIGEYFYVLSSFRQTSNSGFFNPLGVGIEIETGGHVFHINFTNSKGIIENQFLPYTQSSWLEAEFRLGFNISRVFYL